MATIAVRASAVAKALATLAQQQEYLAKVDALEVSVYLDWQLTPESFPDWIEGGVSYSALPGIIRPIGGRLTPTSSAYSPIYKRSFHKAPLTNWLRFSVDNFEPVTYKSLEHEDI